MGGNGDRIRTVEGDVSAFGLTSGKAGTKLRGLVYDVSPCRGELRCNHSMLVRSTFAHDGDMTGVYNRELSFSNILSALFTCSKHGKPRIGENVLRFHILGNCMIACG